MKRRFGYPDEIFSQTNKSFCYSNYRLVAPAHVFVASNKKKKRYKKRYSNYVAGTNLFSSRKTVYFSTWYFTQKFYFVCKGFAILQKKEKTTSRHKNFMLKLSNINSVWERNRVLEGESLDKAENVWKVAVNFGNNISRILLRPQDTNLERMIYKASTTCFFVISCKKVHELRLKLFMMEWGTTLPNNRIK